MLKTGVEVYLHAFLTSALDGREWSSSCPSCQMELYCNFQKFHTHTFF